MTPQEYLADTPNRRDERRTIMAEGARMLTEAGQWVEGRPPEGPGRVRRFVLDRAEDLTGVSGVGEVAEGVCFSDGTVALRWTGLGGTPQSTVVYAVMADVITIHGHDGATTVRWLD